MTLIKGRTWSVLGIATLLVTSACGSTSHSTHAPVSQQSMTTAGPPPSVGFPDLSSLNTADVHRYEVVDTPRVQGFAFTTADGLHCANNAYPTPDSEWVRCWGPRPDRGPGLWSVRADRNAAATVEQLASNPDFTDVPTVSPPLLPASSKIDAEKGVSTCGITADNVTACKVGDHGFVLSPTATTVF